MTSFRFIHAADIHLDSPLRGLSSQEGNVTEFLRNATREALDQLVRVAIGEAVDFVVIAGDLYDGDWRDYKTGLFFAGQMGKLNAADIPVYLLHGNHDAESQITKRLELPQNVHVFEGRNPQTFALQNLNVVLHGQSYQRRDVTENLVTAYPEPERDAFNIGVLHTGLGGKRGHANYAPCSLDDLINKGYDYWALGHVHQAEVLHERPHIVFSGNLQGRHVRETGEKGAYLVTVQVGEIVDLKPVSCDVVRWTVLSVPLDEATNLGDVIDSVRTALETAVAEQSDGRLLVCRIGLEGRSEVHDLLIASEDQILAEARAIAVGLGEEVAWVEKVIVATEPTVDLESFAQREDAVGELQQMLQEATSDESLISEIENDIGTLVRSLPHEIRTEIEDRALKAAVEGEYAALVQEVEPYLSARLVAREE